jgi:hypothetical protein
MHTNPSLSIAVNFIVTWAKAEIKRGSWRLQKIAARETDGGEISF